MSKWDLSIFYPSLEAWDEDVKALPAHIEKLASFKGKLGDFESFNSFYLAEEEATKLLWETGNYKKIW